MNNYHIDTKCIQSGYEPKNGEARVLPIYQSTTYKYDSSEHVAKLFDLEEEGFFYTRLANPSVDCVERKIADLEGGIAAMCTSSGQAATMVTILNICNVGDHIISSSNIYGGTMNLLAVTLKKMGIECTFVDPDASIEELQGLVKDNTKLVFAETIANPSLVVADLEKLAKFAHYNDLPLIVDNTFATPINCRPIEHGADIVLHSTSKYMDGHAVALGGVIVDSGNFNWDNGKFPGLSTPDESYHGMVYTRDCGRAAYITKARVQLMRDMGMAPSPNNAFLLNLGLETLHLRMERHCSNAMKVAEYLEQHNQVLWVNFPGLKSNKYYDLAKKYLPKGVCGVISFGIKGGRQAAVKFMDSLKLASIVVHVADARTSVLHPASTTHRQLNDQQLADCGISPEMIRMSIGIENVDDILNDIEQAFRNI
ncbi:O-acetylhomoserine aminocarboxypropyltransferase/cysteine synthase family protein [Herbinix luporum]|jgi:O-acetylhomoserine (thiol)-lyase|uniref:O-acetylhomoserine aminocarboxypropyltransferase/cysteine synthase family protein n=1 Tax=Herbinix luporum TaxID=1679721 RepID=UPI0017754290|nr:O-acetylhomoserine aminocarboxypropyltransferase/cysteine synthase [Herbinix luporum]MDI9487733.1 O-acetylhomoserine aminocarboxypropyltransferase/cysteine synthase [Bacillota bacterium]HHT57076.1 O-acetylhomoserine aminocarboxypropyltransferase/cysteine synthase [Herbinix luporum]